MIKITEENVDAEEIAHILTNQIKDVFWVVDMKLAFIYVSKSSLHVAGYEPHEIQDMPIDMLLADRSRKLVKKALQEAMNLEAEVGPEGYKAPPLELEVIRKDKKKICIEVSRKFIRDDNGKPIGIVGIARDISRRKLAEKQYVEEKVQAEFYNSILAHDLSNIHQGILASLELILDFKMPEDARDLLKAAHALTRRGVRLTTDVKRLAELALVENLTEINPRLAMETAIEMVHHSLPRRHIRIEIIDDRKGDFVYADQFLVYMFFNLLHNAARLDRNEEIKIDVVISRSEKDKFVKFEIIDRGPGLDDRSKRFLFSTSANHKNSIRGLGLTLVKQIIDRYGGEIAVEDRIEGKHSDGARFVVKIPAVIDSV
ncbi:MAG: PAS domain S-box protein [Candidatus Lokiarchaeota archaeon]|nr:PAS domain S-box protein [Candidatus Lokiarchaeota archaeon]